MNLRNEDTKMAVLTASKLYLTLVNIYDVPPPQAETMVCIAYHESKFDTDAVNYYNNDNSVDRGLFQVNSVHLQDFGIADVKLFNMNTNIRVALEIYRRQGVKAWAVWRKCV